MYDRNHRRRETASREYGSGGNIGGGNVGRRRIISGGNTALARLGLAWDEVATAGTLPPAFRLCEGHVVSCPRCTAISDSIMIGSMTIGSIMDRIEHPET